MIGRETQCVDCRQGMGLGLGGGLAQRGTLSETGRPDVVAVAMSPGRRHITKPVCEITHGLRREGIQVSVLVLNAGAGIPEEKGKPARGSKFGLTEREFEQIGRHRVALIHLGNVKAHVISKAKLVLRFAAVPAIIACQIPIDFEDFAKEGVPTAAVKPPADRTETKGYVAAIVSGIVRGQTCPRKKINETVRHIRRILEEQES